MKRDVNAKKKPSSVLPAQQILRAIPHANKAMKITRAEDGRALVEVPLKPQRLGLILKWILPMSTHRRVELDPMGISVLDMCDGRRTVETIIEEFAAANKLSFREAQLSIADFLKQLTHRGLVAIVGLNEDNEEK